MKKILLIIALMALHSLSYCQWQLNGYHIYNTNSGNVGIGTMLPYNYQGWNRVLDVKGSAHSKILATTNLPIRNGVFAHDTWYGGGGFVGTETNHNLYFIVNYAAKAVLTTDGYLGLGITNPMDLLDVNGYTRLRVTPLNQNENTFLVTDPSGRVQSKELPSIKTVATGSLFIGENAGTNATSNSSYNTGFGLNALSSITSGFWHNTAVGNSALKSAATCHNNSAMGSGSMIYNTTGSDNSAFGMGALNYNTTGSANTAIGEYALSSNISGSYNTALGAGAGTSPNLTISNSTAIGAGAKVSVNNGIVLGTLSNYVGIRQNSPTYALHVQNAYCDGNTWFNASDRNLKENFRAITRDGILEKVMQLKIERWNYIGEGSVSHIGPTAQDFNSVFQLGGNDKVIASVDEGGIALAAIQELNLKTERLEKLVTEQQQIIASLLQGRMDKDQKSDVVSSGIRLEQNTPNPFKLDTRIAMYIPDPVQHAVLYIYDMNGKALEEHVITSRGNTSIVIHGGKLSSGIYLYTLIADGDASDVKRMILTN